MIFKEIKQEAKLALKGNRLMFFLAILAVVFISGALGALIVGFLICPALFGGLYLLGKSLLEKQEFDFGKVFSLFKNLNHVLKLFGVALLSYLFIMLGLILLIIPGIILAYSYSQALYIMVENPEISITEALRRSKELMRGHKFEFFIFQLSFILHYLLGVITLFIYFIYFIPYYHLSMHNYYYHLTGQHNKKTSKSDDLVEVEFA